MKKGDRVQFNTVFSNGGVTVGLVLEEDVGEVLTDLYNGYHVVGCKGQRWLCKVSEIRPEGTETTQAMKDAMRAEQELINDFSSRFVWVKI